jgi:hypothetical protein
LQSRHRRDAPGKHENYGYSFHGGPFILVRALHPASSMRSKSRVGSRRLVRSARPRGWCVLADNWTVLRLNESGARLVAAPQRRNDNQGGVRPAATLARYARAGCPYGRSRREPGLRPRCRGSEDAVLHETAFGGNKGGRQPESRRPKSREEMPKEGTADIRVSGEKCSGDFAANC